MSKILKSAFVLSLVLAFLLPLSPLQACTGSACYNYYYQPPQYNQGTYTYRSTVLGNAIHSQANGVYEIGGERYHFSTSDSVHALARIFNITNVHYFKFRFELLRDGTYYKEWQSNEYRPNGAWWAETYAWHNFGKLPAGQYDIRTYISLNGASWEQRDTKHFTVGSTYGYQDPYYTYNYQYQPTSYQPYYPPTRPYYGHPGYYYGYQYHQPEYQHGYTKIGTGVQNTQRWYYRIVNERYRFDTDENIFVLTQLKDIQYVDRFKLKYEIYKNGNNKYKTHEGSWFYPDGQLWKENYNSYKIGKMPEGEHEVRVYIRINDDSYRHIATEEFEVDRDYYDDYDHDAQYHFDYTYIGSRVDKIGAYEYRMIDPGNTFYEMDYVRALTRLSEIRYVDKFRVKHVLYRDGKQIQSKEGEWQYPRHNWWYYNYTVSDFGRLIKDDDYTVKTYVRVDNGAYKYHGERDFKVLDQDDYYNYTYHHNYNYQPNYYYQPGYYPYGYDNTFYPPGWSDPGGQYVY